MAKFIEVAEGVLINVEQISCIYPGRNPGECMVYMVNGKSFTANQSAKDIRDLARD